MKYIYFLIFTVVSGNTFCQSNIKIDSLRSEIEILKQNINRIESEIEKEVSINGIKIKVIKKYSFSDILVKREIYGEVIDTLINGEEIRILAKDHFYYKIRMSSGVEGFISTNDLKIENSDSPILTIPRFGYIKKPFSSTVSTSSRSKKKKGSNKQTKNKRFSTGKTYYRGPKGGCYFYNSNGKKQYVSRDLCR